nr:unnamed protein product [Spirometra erinaceieuropaei]
MSARKCANYRRLNALPTAPQDATDVQYVPPEYQLPARRMFDRSALRVHCQRLLYFILFYALLAAFFFNYMSWLMYFQVSRDYPKLTGAHSAIGMNPGLSFVPHPDIFNSLIRIQSRVPLPISLLNDHITAFLHSYQDNTGCTEREDCVKEGGLTQDPERPCAYDVNAGGPCNMVNGFGYDTAQPCFALKMSKIYGWLPDPVDGADGVLVRCEGYDEDDTNHLGVIRYFDMDYKFSAIPPGKNPGKLDNGTFRSMYFPYRNQACYHQPLVFVQFDGITRYTLIRVRCYLIAKNIHVDFERGEGSVSFEILAD